MLVLTRKPNQSFQIGPDIWIHILSVRGCQVKIGIDAPKDCQILRQELDDYEQPPVREALP